MNEQLTQGHRINTGEKYFSFHGAFKKEKMSVATNRLLLPYFDRDVGHVVLILRPS